jgi:tetratricopeptide (TPR) repeat protein
MKGEFVLNILNKIFGKPKSNHTAPNTQYDLNSLEAIEAIPIPEYAQFSGVASPVNNIEYILQRKATEHKRNGRMDLAIACLRKSNEIFPHSNFAWSLKDYLRLVEYLKQAGKFKEAANEEKAIRSLFHIDSPFNESWMIYKHSSAQLRDITDNLIFVHDPDCCCSECAKYTRRILSEKGHDKRFLTFPEFLKSNLPEHEFCLVSFSPFFEEFSSPYWPNFKGNLLNCSDRPLKDERTHHQKEYFRERVITVLQDRIDRKNYDILREHYSEIAPKSYGGFRRMKNMRSKNYLKLVDICKKQEIDLDEKPDLSIYHF